MDTNIAAALISGGAGLIGSAAGNLFNIGSVRETNRANMQIAQDQRDFYLKMWNKENQYNTPAAQMQRLSAAGLNPSLMYGEGAGGLPASATINPYDAPRMVAPTVNPMESAQLANIAADTMLKKSQSNVNESQIEVNKGIVKVNDSVVMYNSELTSMTKKQQDKIVVEMQALGKQVEEADSRIAANYASIQKMSIDAYQRSVELSLKAKETDAICDKYAAETDMTREQLKYVGLLAMAKVRNLNADAALKSAQIELTEAQKKQCEQYTSNLSVINGQLVFQLNQDQKYSDAERSVAIYKAIADFVKTYYETGDIKVGSFVVPGGRARSAHSQISNVLSNISD